MQLADEGDRTSVKRSTAALAASAYRSQHHDNALTRVDELQRLDHHLSPGFPDLRAILEARSEPGVEWSQAEAELSSD